MTSATFILFLWTVVASDRLSTHTDWRPAGEFQTAQSCAEAARLLNLKPTHFRCVPK